MTIEDLNRIQRDARAEQLRPAAGFLLGIFLGAVLWAIILYPVFRRH